MKLAVLPQAASFSNGYGIVVNSDYERLQLNAQDKVVWYVSRGENIQFKEHHQIVKRPKTLSMKRVINVLNKRPSTDLWSKDLGFLKLNTDLDEIFCGDTLLYNALREKYRNTTLKVRFHNCYYRISERLKVIGFKPDIKFRYLLNSFQKLEKEIFADEKVVPIFLCEEDLMFYEAITGNTNAQLWGVEVDTDKMKSSYNITYNPIKTLVYFGGVDTHKRKSIDYFIESILPKIQSKLPNLEFHLYGGGTEIYHNKYTNVAGHGRYEGDNFPRKDDGLYLNPDLTGGGVKIKVKTYLENGIRFITSPFGFEGYDKTLIDNTNTFIHPMHEWEKEIINIITDI